MSCAPVNPIGFLKLKEEFGACRVSSFLAPCNTYHNVTSFSSLFVLVQRVWWSGTFPSGFHISEQLSINSDLDEPLIWATISSASLQVNHGLRLALHSLYVHVCVCVSVNSSGHWHLAVVLRSVVMEEGMSSRSYTSSLPSFNHYFTVSHSNPAQAHTEMITDEITLVSQLFLLDCNVIKLCHAILLCYKNDQKSDLPWYRSLWDLPLLFRSNKQTKP